MTVLKKVAAKGIAKPGGIHLKEDNTSLHYFSFKPCWRYNLETKRSSNSVPTRKVDSIHMSAKNSISVVARKCVWILPLLHLSFAAGSEPAIDFRRQIQPILSEHCNVCHGADESTRQAGLRLDVESLAYLGGESGAPAIVPGNSAASNLFQRIASSDPDVVMPPPAAKKPLNEAKLNLPKKRS